MTHTHTVCVCVCGGLEGSSHLEYEVLKAGPQLRGGVRQQALGDVGVGAAQQLVLRVSLQGQALKHSQAA